MGLKRGNHKKSGGSSKTKKIVIAVIITIIILLLLLIIYNRFFKNSESFITYDNGRIPMPNNIQQISTEYNLQLQQSGSTCPIDCLNNNQCTWCGTDPTTRQDYCPASGQQCAIIGTGVDNNPVYKVFPSYTAMAAYQQAHGGISATSGSSSSVTQTSVGGISAYDNGETLMPQNIPVISSARNVPPQTKGGICPGNCGQAQGAPPNSNCTWCGINPLTRQDYCPRIGQTCAIIGKDSNGMDVYKAFASADDMNAYQQAATSTTATTATTTVTPSTGSASAPSTI